MLDFMRNDDMGKLVVRLTLGVLMLFHGISKVLHPGSLDFISSNIAAHGLPGALAYAVYIGEILAPLMLIFGFHARTGGLLVVINMLVAIALVHTGDLLSLTDHGGYRLELQAFYLFGGLAMMFMGSGRYAAKPD